MLLPDKPPRDGRVMANLLDIYDLKNLIHEATRITKTSETLLDLFLTDNLRKIQSSGVVHVNISDHSLVFAMLRALEPRIRSRNNIKRTRCRDNRQKTNGGAFYWLFCQHRGRRARDY